MGYAVDESGRWGLEATYEESKRRGPLHHRPHLPRLDATYEESKLVGDHDVKGLQLGLEATYEESKRRGGWHGQALCRNRLEATYEESKPHEGAYVEPTRSTFGSYL